jgi:hypothetical protein
MTAAAIIPSPRSFCFTMRYSDTKMGTTAPPKFTAMTVPGQLLTTGMI